MNKSLVALFAALVAVATMFASTAEAGLKIKLGFGGPMPHFMAHGNGGHAKRMYYRKRYVARRAAKQKTVVAKKSKPAVTKVAKVSKPKVVAAAPVETVEEPEVIADTENSSIASAVATGLDKAASADEAQPVEVKADATDAAAELKRTSKLDCKKFFPSVGMTLTVPCE
jgi:hypothetical protein